MDFFLISVVQAPSPHVRDEKATALLGGDEVDDHVDDAGAAGAGAEVHAGAPDFVLQQLVQLPAQHFHQLSHLEGKKRKAHRLSKASFSGTRSSVASSWILVFT